MERNVTTAGELVTRNALHRRTGVWTRTVETGPFNYSDGADVEAHLRGVFVSAQDLSSGSPELEAHIVDWPSEYHLSSLRPNLLRALDLSRARRVLELGSGCGALTRYLAEQGVSVDAVEGSPARAELTWLRCRDLDSVNVVCSNFNDLEIPGDYYDCVFLVGVLEYAGRFHPGAASHRDAVAAIVGRLRPALRPGGIIVTAIENRLGLKYLFGAAEDHHFLPYLGVYDYFGDDDVRTYTRTEWIEMLTAIGIEHWRFCYPFPDYKLPTVVLSDRYIRDTPHVDAHLSHIVSRDYGRRLPWGLREREFWRGLQQQQLLGAFANSFLITIGNDEGALEQFPEHDFVHSSSPMRRPEFRTVSIKRRGEEAVAKQSLYGDAQPLPGAVVSHRLTSERYIPGEPLSEVWHRCIASYGDLDRFEPLLREYYDFLRNSVDRYDDSGEMVDLLPGNIIVAAHGDWHAVDHEWVLNREIDADYVLWRALLYTAVDNRLSLRELFQRHGLSNLLDFVDACFKRLALDVHLDLQRFLRIEDDLQRSIKRDDAATGTEYQLRQEIDCWEFHPELSWTSAAAYPARQSMRATGLMGRQRQVFTFTLPPGVLQIVQVSFRPGIRGIVHIYSITVTARGASGAPEELFSLRDGQWSNGGIEFEGVEPIPGATGFSVCYFESEHSQLIVDLLQHRDADLAGYAVTVEMDWPKSTEFGFIEKHFVARQGQLDGALIRSRRNVAQLRDRLADLERDNDFLVTALDASRADMAAIKSSRAWKMVERYRASWHDGVLARIAPRRFSIDRAAGKPQGRTSRHDLNRQAYVITSEQRTEMLDAIRAMPDKPKISIVLPAYNTDVQWLDRAVRSVRGQIYENWELCLVDDGSTDVATRGYVNAVNDPKIRVVRLPETLNISGATNAGIAVATGEYVGLLDHDDELTADALFCVVAAINREHPELIYSDEDLIDVEGRYVRPYFKPDFAPDLLLSHNYITHFLVIETALLTRLGGLRSKFDGAQDYDLVLRATELTDRICHIPRVLYHWRQTELSTSLIAEVKPMAAARAKQVVEDALRRRDIRGEVLNANMPYFFRVKRHIRRQAKVSIVVPFKDQPDLLDACIGRILDFSTYPEFEIVAISNGSRLSETRDVMHDYERADERVRFYELDVPFNFSRLVNYGTAKATGEQLVLLNNDIRIISWSWIEALLEHSQRPEIGAVGGKLYYPNNTVQHAGIIVGIDGYAGHAHKRTPSRGFGYFNRLNIIHNVSAVTGAFMMVEKRLFESFGGFDADNFRVACNDVDFCLRLLADGKLNVFTPYAEAYHVESASRGYEITAEKKARFDQEKQVFGARHREFLDRGDPFYNPNLTLEAEDFTVRQTAN